MGDGHLNFCKECVKARVARHREESLGKIQDYDRKRYRENVGRQQALKRFAERHFSDEVKRRASRATSNAIRDGRLRRPIVCSDCSKQCKPEAHHDDYTRPLEVRWLCRSCHVKFHKRTSRAEPML